MTSEDTPEIRKKIKKLEERQDEQQQRQDEQQQRQDEQQKMMEEIVGKLESVSKSDPKPTNKFIRSKKPENDLEKKLDKHDLTPDEFNSVFNTDNGRIILMKGGEGDSNAETNLRSTLLFLTGNFFLHDSKSVSSSELRKRLAESGVRLKSHSTTLKKHSSYILHKRGPIGSTKTSYEITQSGIQKGIDLIKDVVRNTSSFDIELKQGAYRKKEKAEKIDISEEDLKRGIKNFVKQNNISEEKLKTFFDFQTEGVRICNLLKEKTRRTLQLKTLILLGALLKKVYDIDSFSGKDTLKNSGVVSDRLDLLDANKHYKKYFSKKPKSAMRLTYAGEKKGLEMLKEYLENEDCKL